MNGRVCKAADEKSGSGKEVIAAVKLEAENVLGEREWVEGGSSAPFLGSSHFFLLVCLAC